MTEDKPYDIAIIGAGIVSLCIATRLKTRNHSLKILIIEKERDVSMHASGRNSGVLHAGFYYSADSFKAQFSAEGRKKMIEFCRNESLRINQCGKLVVAQNETERLLLHELKQRALNNSANVQIVDEKEVAELEENAKTFQEALWSPDTASVDPIEISLRLKKNLILAGVVFAFNEQFINFKKKRLLTDKKKYQVNYIINCGGSYADKIANQFNLATEYALLPFKGLYLSCTQTKITRRHIYPVPDLNYPFLGVHFTVTVDGKVKVGPTAMPAFWREQYQGFENFNALELLKILTLETHLFASNAFAFRTLAFNELKKYRRSVMIQLSKKLIKTASDSDFGGKIQAGIRAQLVHKQKKELVTDFLIMENEESLHILNIISPGFTCSFALADYVLDRYLLSWF